MNLFITIYIYNYCTPTLLLLLTPSQDMPWTVYKIMQTQGLTFKNSRLDLLIFHFSAVPTLMQHLLILIYRKIFKFTTIHLVNFLKPHIYQISHIIYQEFIFKCCINSLASLNFNTYIWSSPSLVCLENKVEVRYFLFF